MNVNVEIKSIITLTWRMKGTNNDVTNSKLFYALGNQNTTTVHAYKKYDPHIGDMKRNLVTSLS